MSLPSGSPSIVSPLYFGTNPAYGPIPPRDMSAFQFQPAPSMVDKPGVSRNVWTGEEMFQGPMQVDINYTQVWVWLVCSMFDCSDLPSLLVS